MSSAIIAKLEITQRLETAIKIKKGLNDVRDHNGISEGSLKYISDILNTWVKDGLYKGGKIELPNINKTLIYQLSTPDKTVVKLTGKGTGL